MKPFRITVSYDNHPPENTVLKSSWGFACMIEGVEKTILFDTVIISHGDWGHIVGIWIFLDANPAVEVYLPGSLSRHLKDEVRDHGARLISVDPDRIEVCPDVVLSGEMEGPRNEQAVLLQTGDKQIVITGSVITPESLKDPW